MSSHPNHLPPPDVAVCMKWTARPGAEETDERFAGVSAADQAALEIGLRLAERLGSTVTVVSVGPAGADIALRDALACGAHHAIRLAASGPIDSPEAARLLAGAVGEARIVVCGDYSLDRGTGSVPAFVAAALGAAQALGLVAVDAEAATPASVSALRRLDGGRREELVVPLPCVLSVEGGTVALRRAPLRTSLAARSATIDVRPVAPFRPHGATAVVTPYRPRARVMPAPAGAHPLQRVHALVDLGGGGAHGDTVELAPREAAARIVAALRDWGYLV